MEEERCLKEGKGRKVMGQSGGGCRDSREGKRERSKFVLRGRKEQRNMGQGG